MGVCAECITAMSTTQRNAVRGIRDGGEIKMILIRKIMIVERMV